MDNNRPSLNNGSKRGSNNSNKPPPPLHTEPWRDIIIPRNRYYNCGGCRRRVPSPRSIERELIAAGCLRAKEVWCPGYPSNVPGPGEKRHVYMKQRVTVQLETCSPHIAQMEREKRRQPVIFPSDRGMFPCLKNQSSYFEGYFY